MDFPIQLIQIDHQSKLPLYDQIEHNLRDLIIQGHLQPGESLPAEKNLAHFYGVNRLTVRRALDELAQQNWVIRRRGVGTFINRPAIVSIAPAKLSFTEEMRSIGRHPSSQLISLQVIPASHNVAGLLQIPPDTPLIELTRVRLADSIPLLLETSCLVQTRFPRLERESSLARNSLYALLEKDYHVQITGMDQTLRPVLLTAEQADYLQVEPGTPAIASEIVAYSSTGEPVEYSWSVASGDKCEFYFRFRHGSLA